MPDPLARGISRAGPSPVGRPYWSLMMTATATRPSVRRTAIRSDSTDRSKAVTAPFCSQGNSRWHAARAVDGGEPPLGQQPGPAVPVTQRRPQPTSARGGIPYREDDTGGLLSPGQTQQA